MNWYKKALSEQMTLSEALNILGLQKGCSIDELKQKYRELALKYHPDKNPGNKHAEDMMKIVNNAMEIIKKQIAKGWKDFFRTIEIPKTPRYTDDERYSDDDEENSFWENFRKDFEEEYEKGENRIYTDEYQEYMDNYDNVEYWKQQMIDYPMAFSWKDDAIYIEDYKYEDSTRPENIKLSDNVYEALSKGNFIYEYVEAWEIEMSRFPMYYDSEKNTYNDKPLPDYVIEGIKNDPYFTDKLKKGWMDLFLSVPCFFDIKKKKYAKHDVPDYVIEEINNNNGYQYQLTAKWRELLSRKGAKVDIVNGIYYYTNPYENVKDKSVIPDFVVNNLFKK